MGGSLKAQVQGIGKAEKTYHGKFSKYLTKKIKKILDKIKVI